MFEKVRPFIKDQMKRSKSLYLFDHEGHYISDISVFRKRKWHKLLRDLDIEYCRIYCTRHTFITAMLNSNQYKLLTIAKIVGHNTIETLIENYAGFIKDDHLKINVEMDIFRESFVKVPKMMKL
jgi:integrase